MNSDWQIAIEFVRRFKWLYVVSILAGILASILLWYSSTRFYRATVLIAPVEEGANDLMANISGQLGGLSGLIGLNSTSNTQITEVLAILTSRGFVADFITNSEISIYLEEVFSLEAPTRNDLYEVFVKKILSVHQDSSTGLISVSVLWIDGHVAAQWANSLVTRLNNRIRENAIQEAAQSIEYLYSELESSPIKGIQESIFALIESEIRKTTLARVRNEYAVKVIDAAVAPDLDDPAKPRPLMIFGVSIFLAIVFGTLIGLAVQFLTSNANRSH